MNESTGFEYLTSLWWFWPLMIWSIIWKGLALWQSAQKSEKKWFIAFLVVNTAGILEILYLYFFTKKTKSIGK